MPRSASLVTPLDSLPFPIDAYGRIAARELRRRPDRSQLDGPIELVAHGIPLGGPRLRAFRRIVKDRGAGVPLTWPNVLATPLQTQLASLPAFPVSPMGLVHTEQTIERLAKLDEHDEVTVRTALNALEATERGPKLTITTTIERGDRTLWRGVSVALHRPTRRKGPKKKPAAVADATIPAVSASLRFGSGAGRAYSLVSWDFNPIHLAAPLARPFGFRRAILHGMATVGHAVSVLAPPDDGPATLTARFRRPLLLPGSAQLAAWPLHDSEDEAAATPGGQSWRVASPDGSTLHVEGSLRYG